MKIKKILLILTLLSTNFYLTRAQEDKPREIKPDISTIINDDIKMLISNLLLTDGGSLKDLFSYLSTNKEIAENFAKYDYLEGFIIKYINSLDSDQQKEVFKYIIEVLGNEEYRDAKVALGIIKKLCNTGIMKNLVDNILASETALQDILDYYPMNKEADIYIKKNGLYNCLQKDIEEYINKNNDNKKKQLFNMAAKTGHLYIIELLLGDEGIALMDKVVALIYAAKNGHINIVKLLLKEKNIPYPDKGFALKYAAEGGYQDIVELLLKEEGINPIDKGLALRNAAEGGYQDIVKLIEENIISKNKNFALVWAAEDGRKDTVEQLLEKEDIPIPAKRAALVYAAKNGHKDIVKLLLKEEGVATSKNNGKALIEAACNGYKNIVKLLLQKDISSSDKSSALKCIDTGKAQSSDITVYEDIAKLIEDSMNFKDKFVHWLP